MKKYLSIWLKLAVNALQETYNNRFTNILFFIGKILRFCLFLLLLFAIKNNIPTIGHYNSSDLLVFFLVFNWIDTLAQLLFRGVYTFSQQIKSGEFDFDLIRPIKPLFRALFGKPDINDAVFVIPITITSVYLLRNELGAVTLAQWLWFSILVVNGLLIATSFHIFVLCLGILTTEVDNAIMLYRDTTNFARFPVDIYQGVIRMLFVTVLPVGIMITVPAQVLTGTQLIISIPLSILVGGSFFTLSIITWKKALKEYSSASS